MAVELRDIEIFLTLADELHFGRTAARLHVSPARISQSIKQQERRVGATLFERTSRTVRLTPVGQQLCDDLRPIYHGLKASIQRATRAANGITDVLRVGMVPSTAYDLRPFWDTFRSQNPQCALQIRHNPFIEPFVPVRRGDIDVLIAWLPVAEPDLVAGPVIHTEHRVLAVADEHPLADDGMVSLEALANDYGVATGQPRVPDYWEDIYCPFATPSGRPIANRLPVTDLEDILTRVSMGEIVHPLGAQAPRYFYRPGIRYLPIHDAPRLNWGLIWRRENDNPLVRALAQIVRDLGPMRLP